MRNSLGAFSILLYSTLLVLTGCSESSNPLGADVAAPAEPYQPVDLASLERAARLKASRPSLPLSKSGGVVYTFDDLPAACMWNREFPETYQDLTFSDSRFLATCELNEDIGIVPVSLSEQDRQTRTTITLPSVANEVSISYYGMRFDHRDRIFVAYDESGVEVDRASGRTVGSWDWLTITGTVHQVAIIDYQSQSIWDDITVIFDTSNEPPIADAVTPQTVIVSETVALDGSNSSDPEGDPLTYLWSWTSKPAGSLAEISTPSSPLTAFTADQPGTYTVQLVVDDGLSSSAPDVVEIVALSVSGAVSILRKHITLLQEERMLNAGQANALHRKLWFVDANAVRRPYAAAQRLRAFANQVASFVDGGVLPPHEGDLLLEYASRISAALGYPSIPS